MGEIGIAVFLSGICFGIAIGINIGVFKERRSAHEAWGAPSKPEPRHLSQSAVLEAIRAEFEYPRPLGVQYRPNRFAFSPPGRSRVSVDREGAVTRMQISDFGRFAGEAET